MPVDEHEPAAELRPWTPPCDPGDLLEDTTRLSYLVVDEIVGDIVTLALAPWPGSDALGRVRFPDDAVGARAGHLLVHHRELRERLYEGFMRRAPRVGDAFAAVLGDEVSRRLAESGEVVLDRELRLADALPGRIADLTAEARNVAKLAFYAAVAGVQLHDSARALGQVPKNGHDVRPRVGEVRREPRTGPVLPGQDQPAAGGPKRWTVPRTHWPAPATADLRQAISDRVADAYREHLFGETTLRDLPDFPRFIFCATNLQTASLFRFSKPYVADHRLGLARGVAVPLAVAVAASSAFPP